MMPPKSVRVVFWQDFTSTVLLKLSLQVCVCGGGDVTIKISNII